MKLFINDIPVKIKRMDKEVNRDDFTIIMDGQLNKDFSSVKLFGNVLVWNSNKSHIEKIFKKMREKKFKKLESITFAVKDKEEAVRFIKDQFKVIKAAGGVVIKDDKLLFIYRLKKWDLPKGKLDKKESIEDAAVREVEEECNVKVRLGKKIGSTWHTYMLNGKKILKKTSWFTMICLDDAKMKPQYEEDIEDLRWMDRNEVTEALKNSYRTIEDVISKYYKLEAKPVEAEPVAIKTADPL